MKLSAIKVVCLLGPRLWLDVISYRDWLTRSTMDLSLPPKFHRGTIIRRLLSRRHSPTLQSSLFPRQYSHRLIRLISSMIDVEELVLDASHVRYSVFITPLPSSPSLMALLTQTCKARWPSDALSGNGSELIRWMYLVGPVCEYPACMRRPHFR
jgi:hypothetical protein